MPMSINGSNSCAYSDHVREYKQMLRSDWSSCYLVAADPCCLAIYLLLTSKELRNPDF